MSALFAKTWRINKILGARVNRFRRIVVGPRDVMLPGVLTVLGNLIVLLIWQLLDPLRLVKVDDKNGPVDRFGRPLELIDSCESERGLDGYFVSSLLILNGAIIIAANIQAYRARHITTEFSESRYIGLAMGVILQSIVVGLPVLIYDSGSEADYIARTIIMIITCLSILMLIFVPKVGVWLKLRRLLRDQEGISSENFIDRRQEGEGQREDGHDGRDYLSSVLSVEGLQVLSYGPSLHSLKRSKSDRSSGIRARNTESSANMISIREYSASESEHSKLQVHSQSLDHVAETIVDADEQTPSESCSRDEQQNHRTDASSMRLSVDITSSGVDPEVDNTEKALRKTHDKPENQEKPE